MRAFVVSALARSFAFSFVALSSAAPALTAPMQDSAAEALRTEALQNTGRDNWKGRQHYLYDDEYRPETDGAAPHIKGCTEEAVRMQRSDGRSTIKRINRCD
jgi:hypothetical protein